MEGMVPSSSSAERHADTLQHNASPSICTDIQGIPHIYLFWQTEFGALNL